RPASQTGQWPWQGRLRAEEYHADRSPRCAGKTGWREVPCNALIPGPRERHQQRTRCPSVQITLGERAWFLATAHSRFGNPIAKEPGLAILSPGGVCLDSALHWWLRLLRVVPVCNSEPGSVFGLITGDPEPRGYFPRSCGSRW